MAADEPTTLADQAAAWIPPWARKPEPDGSRSEQAPVEAEPVAVAAEPVAVAAEPVAVAAEPVAVAAEPVEAVLSIEVEQSVGESDRENPADQAALIGGAAEAEPQSRNEMDADADADTDVPRAAVGWSGPDTEPAPHAALGVELEPDTACDVESALDPVLEAESAPDPVLDVELEPDTAYDVESAPDAARDVAAEIEIGTETAAAVTASSEVGAEVGAEPVGEVSVASDVEAAAEVSAEPAGDAPVVEAEPEVAAVAAPADAPAPAVMSGADLLGAVEAILLVVDEPVGEVMLAQVLDQPTDRVLAALMELAEDYGVRARGFDLRRAAGGWRLYTRAEYSTYVERFVLDGQQARLTQAALETLAVVAYKQPVTRSRISAIRGVNCDGVVRTLVSRGLIEECGSEPDSGAFLYRTTAIFLEKLGLNSLDELPALAPFLPDDVDEIANAQS